jgi:uncharacterized protein YidB (DUF937 family)
LSGSSRPDDRKTARDLFAQQIEEAHMSVLDKVSDALKVVLGQGGAAEGPALISAVLGKTDLGGMQGIVAELQEGGLGTQVQSWLGDGKNLPISADQIRSALGDTHVQQIAQHLGLPVDAALKLFSEHLPTAVDQASPTGTLQSA